jgi:hypothetical protein
MSKRISKAVTLLALSVLSTFALADAPARVGRIALAEGKVGISAQDGEGAEAALVNWPVTSSNQITTERGARTEIRVGSTAIRLDGDSALDVTELDDDSLRLHLHYGSVSIRVRNADVMRGFEISTPHGRVRLQEPGRVRIDAERTQDTSVVSVFDGVALVDGGGSTLTVRANRRAELRGDDIVTGMAQRDGFDDWAALRDRRDERAVSERYVGTEMTGYEDLDDHGSWRDDAEHGPLWIPRSVPSGWVPYRDGRWTYMNTWGWTWIDNAPWGYAPFHYGRWLMVGNRWCWAPGRDIGRPVWSPALVGWVGGAGWNVNFRSGSGYRQAPAQGWYPLAPRDTFVPHYHVKPDHLRYLNRHAREDGRDGRRDGRHDGRRDGHQRNGLTVVPHDQFGGRHQVVVPSIARATVAPFLAQQAPQATPPAPVRREVAIPYAERHDGIRFGQRRARPDGAREAGVAQPAPLQPQVIQTAPQGGFGYEAQRDERRRDEARANWRAGREGRGDGRGEPRTNAPIVTPQPQQPQPQQPQQHSGGWAGAARQAVIASQREERQNRYAPGENERREAPVYSAQRSSTVVMPQQVTPVPAPMPAPRPMPMPQAAPMPAPVQPAPAPVVQAAPAAAPQPAPARERNEGARNDGPREMRPGRHQMLR